MPRPERELDEQGNVVPISSHERWSRPPAVPAERPTNHAPVADRTKYPSTFRNVLRLHMHENKREADRAFSHAERVPYGLIIIGLAIVGSVIYRLF